MDWLWAGCPALPYGNGYHIGQHSSRQQGHGQHWNHVVQRWEMWFGKISLSLVVGGGAERAGCRGCSQALIERRDLCDRVITEKGESG